MEGLMPFYLNPKVLALIAGGVILALGILVAIFRKLHVALPASAITWKSFLQGQGTILAAFLFLGAALGWVSFRFLGQQPSHTTSQVKLVEFRQLAMNAQPDYESVDSGGYNHLTLYARASAPPSASIAITVAPDTGKPGPQPAIAVQAVASSWTRLDQQISARRLTLIIGGQDASATRATQADVLVFLSNQ
jgi:hypothetical protein